MERKRSLSASSTDSWSVIDHRRTSSCDDTADDAEESISLYFDEAIIASETFASSDEEGEIDESDIIEDSDIELADENIIDSENEVDSMADADADTDAPDSDSDDCAEQETDDEEDEEDEDLEENEKNDSDWSSDEEEVIKESVWVDREDIRESGGLYFESPDHIKSNFDEIDRKEGWKLVSRVLTIYFSIIAVLLAVEAGLQMCNRALPEPDYPVLIADIYGLQYRGVDVDTGDLPSFVCNTNKSVSTIGDKSLFYKPRTLWKYSNASIKDYHEAENYQGFSTYFFKSTPPQLRRNSTRFQVLSRLVQKKSFTYPISFKSSHLCNSSPISLKVCNQTSNSCSEWQKSSVSDGKALRLAQSSELLPQLVVAEKVPVASDICVGQQNRNRLQVQTTFMEDNIASIRSQKKFKQSSGKSQSFGPKAPEPARKKLADNMTRLPSRRIRLAKPNILVAPPRNRLTLPKRSNLSITPSEPLMRLALDSRSSRQLARRSSSSICLKSASKPSLVRSPPPLKYKAPKPVRYSVGPVTERSLVPCHYKKSYLPLVRRNNLRSTKTLFVSSNQRASHALHGFSKNKTSQRFDQCDSRFWKLKKQQIDLRRMRARKAIDHKTPTPCAATYKIESSVVKRQQYHLSERRLYKTQGSSRNSSFSKNGCYKDKQALVRSKKTILPKCRSESKPSKGKEVKPKTMCKHRSRFD